MTRSADLVLPARAELAEGPLWDGDTGQLYWVDILTGRLHRTDPASGRDQAFDLSQPVGCVALRRSGGLVVALQSGFAFFDPGTRRLAPIVDPEVHRPENRFNDGKCDAAGRLWAGTMSTSMEEGAGCLYRLDPDLSVHPMVTGVTIANGLAWSLDGDTFYFIDSIPRRLYAFDFDMATGQATGQRVAVQMDARQGYPDGMAIDAEGKLWIAHYGGGCVRRWDPDAGRILDTIRLPASQVTSCTFGGPDLRTLYITTATEGMSAAAMAAEPLAGGLFAAAPPVGGLPAARFAG